jgi:hypothetical protein
MGKENSMVHPSRNPCSKPFSHSGLPRGFLRSHCRSDAPGHAIRTYARAESAAMSRKRRGKRALQLLVYKDSRETSQVFAPLLHKPLTRAHIAHQRVVKLAMPIWRWGIRLAAHWITSSSWKRSLESIVMPNASTRGSGKPAARLFPLRLR